MPLVRIDLIEGRSKEQITSLLDATHRAIVSAFNVPVRDRYQIIGEHPSSHLVAQDTGLGIERSDNVVIFSITSRPRSDDNKLKVLSGFVPGIAGKLRHRSERCHRQYRDKC